MVLGFFLFASHPKLFAPWAESLSAHQVTILASRSFSETVLNRTSANDQRLNAVLFMRVLNDAAVKPASFFRLLYSQSAYRSVVVLGISIRSPPHLFHF